MITSQRTDQKPPSDIFTASQRYASPARDHAFVPGGLVLSVFEDVDPAAVCSVCLLGRPAHDAPTPPASPTSHRLVGDLGVRVGPMTRRYEIQHPGVIDHAAQVRSIAAKRGRHVAPRRPALAAVFVGDDTATVEFPRIVLTASAPLVAR